MVAFPPAKINLGLQITRKRADGYHDLVTCFYPVPWCDILEILPASETVFNMSGISVPGRLEDNLCLKAYQLLKEQHHLPPVSIHLHKIIPMGAGLGGGSSDAAWTLRLLNQLFDLKLSASQLADYAAKLGSDCAFFIHDKPMIGEGRGEILSPANVSLTDKLIVLVKPDIHVSTADAFSQIKPKPPAISLGEFLEDSPVSDWKNLVVNDFEESVFSKFPVIQNMKEQLYAAGAVYASMSGSGSTVFGIFEKPIDLRSAFPATTYWSGRLA